MNNSYASTLTLRMHREGKTTLLVATALLLGAIYGTDALGWPNPVRMGVGVVFLGLYLAVVQFFRNPVRTTVAQPNEIIAPCDGEVVVIQETVEGEYFQDKRIQVSIFMSPLNVHVNRYPNSGTVQYAKYHPGKFLVAWHPKSSTLNERTTVVVDGPATGPVLYRQIAGAVARRIKMYASVGQQVKTGQESGFIQFGSRVDLFLPLNAEICVKIGDKPAGGVDCIARIPI